MPNILRATLVTLRAELLVGIFQSLLWVAGYSLLFWFSWKVGLGVLLVNWAAEIRRAERKR